MRVEIGGTESFGIFFGFDGTQKLVIGHGTLGTLRHDPKPQGRDRHHGSNVAEAAESK